jgi:ornithine cyclodeaminase/alanine dehydrogenase-like protein (mu-crystallin family)
MRVYSAEETAAALPYAKLVDAIEAMFASGATAPLRHHHTMPREGERDAVLLLMPAWSGRGHGGVKIVNVTPGNAARGLPSITASYLLFEELTGKHLAIFDGATLTARRTAAVSALAARHLAREEARTLLVVGAGRIARELPAAFSAVRPIERVLVWNHTGKNGHALVEELRSDGFAAEFTGDLEAAVGQADITSCATLSTDPVVQGAWLKPGQHLDLIGAFTPQMRETDDEAMRRAKVFIDTEGALTEAGEIRQPIEAGVIAREDIRGTLYDLCSGRGGWRDPDDITLFKGVGHAVEDLAAATVALELAGEG